MTAYRLRRLVSCFCRCPFVRASRVTYLNTRVPASRSCRNCPSRSMNAHQIAEPEQEQARDGEHVAQPGAPPADGGPVGLRQLQMPGLHRQGATALRPAVDEVAPADHDEPGLEQRCARDRCGRPGRRRETGRRPGTAPAPAECPRRPGWRSGPGGPPARAAGLTVLLDRRLWGWDAPAARSPSPPRSGCRTPATCAGSPRGAPAASPGASDSARAPAPAPPGSAPAHCRMRACSRSCSATVMLG